MSKLHILKTDPGPWRAVQARLKGFEFRKNDRDFQVGDFLCLVNNDGFEEQYVIITYMLTGPNYGIPEDYAVLSISHLRKWHWEVLARAVINSLITVPPKQPRMETLDDETLDT